MKGIQYIEHNGSRILLTGNEDTLEIHTMPPLRIRMATYPSKVLLDIYVDNLDLNNIIHNYLSNHKWPITAMFQPDMAMLLVNDHVFKNYLNSMVRGMFDVIMEEKILPIFAKDSPVMNTGQTVNTEIKTVSEENNAYEQQ